MLKRYEVRPAAGGGEWAVIVIDTDRGFFATVSDRGNYAFLWADTGEVDFRSFLIGLEDSPDYLHGKLMSGRAAKVYDGEATEKAVRETIDALPPTERRRELTFLEDADFSSEYGFVLWEHETSLECDTADLFVHAPEPDCLAFCTVIYPRFVAMLREELADEEQGWGVWIQPEHASGFWLNYSNGGGRLVGTRGFARLEAIEVKKRETVATCLYEARKLPLTDDEKHELAARVEVR